MAVFFDRIPGRGAANRRNIHQLGMKPCTSENKARYVQNGRKAFDTVLQFALRTPLTQFEISQISEELDSLRSNLRCLAEAGFGAMPALASSASPHKEVEPLYLVEKGESSLQPLEVVADKAQQFKIQCQQVCTHCSQMLAQNEALMRRTLALPVTAPRFPGPREHLSF
ncbi:MAG TPA: hypothetical protein VNB49_16120 [Candidatus Dormibacteraeota bacterium]|nr:hypothetical protein [Candidatus Dormibacteraeota bacterium]